MRGENYQISGFVTGMPVFELNIFAIPPWLSVLTGRLSLVFIR
jgi:hypothetical protein